MLAIASNIPVLLMTSFVVQGHVGYMKNEKEHFDLYCTAIIAVKLYTAVYFCITICTKLILTIYCFLAKIIFSLLENINIEI